MTALLCKLIEGAGPRSVRLERHSLRIGASEHFIATYDNMSIAVSRAERDELLASGIAWQAEEENT